MLQPYRTSLGIAKKSYEKHYMKTMAISGPSMTQHCYVWENICVIIIVNFREMKMGEKV